ncbi:MAG: sulfatase-like hydrolase/transferase [Planctomycetaceae bacterium]|nr:sulfatase-like hydrolase/transferase [Planctomycetaceae bacterium]
MLTSIVMPRAVWLLLCLSWAGAVLLDANQRSMAADSPRPNILWLVNEDHGPHWGCYGDTYATTPTADRLAAQGVLYTRVWSCAPVCAPARTTIISGLYPPSTGSEHMRSMVAFPADKQMFPQLLRAAGYYCTNNAKEDYNLTQPGQVWDVSSNQGHWKNRAAGQPFFAVFNSGKSHEGQVRKRPHQAIHDPAQVRIPAYHPDTPEVRRDWAQYYDCVSAADADAGLRLAELEAAGLADSTIVFYYADHGAGLPRHKRSACDSGLHVPLIVYVPERFRHLLTDDARPGQSCDRLVSFVDFAPTMLSLAGIEPPAWMQGRAFLGKHASAPQEFLYGFRGRMDERYDLVRSVTDGRYVYVRNYLPHKIPGQHVAYMFQTPTTQVWRRMYDAGELTPAQERFWQPRLPEELYDLRSDRDEVHNLAGDPGQRATLDRLRQALRAWERSIRDLGFLPEGEIHARSAGSTPYDAGHDDAKYPFERVRAAAELASSLDPEAAPELARACAADDSAVRYWGALGLLMRGQPAVAAQGDVLRGALRDSSPDVRIVAAEALVRHGSAEDAAAGLQVLAELGDWSHSNVFTTMAALNALEALGEQGRTVVGDLLGQPKGAAPHARYGEYVPRLLQQLSR